MKNGVSFLLNIRSKEVNWSDRIKKSLGSFYAGISSSPFVALTANNDYVT